MNVVDLIDLQGEFVSSIVQFNLWPRAWSSIRDVGSLHWETRSFGKSYVDTIPEVPGIYTFVINPTVANHPNRYLCYIGKTERTLRERYCEYLKEAETIKGRPKILRLLNGWNGYLEFCYTWVEYGNIRTLEAKLIDAFLPPFNSEFSANIGKITGAF